MEREKERNYKPPQLSTRFLIVERASELLQAIPRGLENSLASPHRLTALEGNAGTGVLLLYHVSHSQGITDYLPDP